MMQLKNGSYQIAGIKQENLKEVLSTITARIPVANIEVKSNKLAYLLAHLKQQEVQQ